MDIIYLTEDEVNVEFEVRNLDRTSVNSLMVLKRMLEEEAAGTRGKPAHSQRLTSGKDELLLCNQKLRKCMGDFVTAQQNADTETLKELNSRVIHLLDRLIRLKEHCPNLDVPNSISQAAELLDKIIALNPRISPDTSGAGFIGFSASDLQPPDENLGAVGGNLGDVVEDRNRTPLVPIPRNQIRPTNPRAATTADANRQSIETLIRPVEPSPINTDRQDRPAYIHAPPQAHFPNERINRDPITMQPPISVPFPSAWPTDPFFSLPSNSRPIVSGASRNIVTAPVASGHVGSFPRNQPMLQPLMGNQNIIEQGENHRQRPNISQAITRWSVKFGGHKNDLPIDEFIFRIENLAAADNVPLYNLVGGLHHLLTDGATDYYWIQRRKYPNANWEQLKMLMLSHFARQENDFELRNLIMNRKQANKEEFNEFSLTVECLAARLRRPMADEELVEILRENMSSRLQDRLLLVPTPTVEILKSTCKKFERLWSSQSERPRDTRFNNRVAEVEWHARGDAIDQCSGGSTQMALPCELDRHRPEPLQLSAISRDLPVVGPANEYVICWNCRDIGHTYVDCMAAERRIFCFGCGESNVIKPRCPKCNSGNWRAGGNPNGRPRPNTYPTNRNNSQM